MKSLQAGRRYPGFRAHARVQDVASNCFCCSYNFVHGRIRSASFPEDELDLENPFDEEMQVETNTAHRVRARDVRTTLS